MTELNADILKPGLKALYYSGIHRLLAPFSQGIGMIFMLHRVLPGEQPAFSPNSGLTVTPEFLDAVIREAKDAGLETVSLDEAYERMGTGEGTRFACFTLDDGYRDNLEHAWPVFKKHGVPFTIYVPSDFPEGKGELWWCAAETLVAGNADIDLSSLNGTGHVAARTVEEKNAAFARIYRLLRGLGPAGQRRALSSLCIDHGIDLEAQCRDLIMSWDELREMSKDPLVTIGAHTVSHPALAKLSEVEARREMQAGAERVAKRLGQWPAHLSYPYGDPESAGPREFRIARELGFKTAVTTRKGVLYPEHADYLTALPRVSLNGAYQSTMFARLYMTGAPFALWNRFRRVNAA